MEKLRGYIGMSGRVAYVPQQPWMQNNTMRNNTMRNNTMRTCGGKPASPHGGGTDARSFCA